MVRQDILKGLETALLRGSSLKEAMMSFYNSGYNKEEIEEAARYILEMQKRIALQKQQASQGKTLQTSKTPSSLSPEKKSGAETQQILQQIKQIPQKTYLPPQQTLPPVPSSTSMSPSSETKIQKVSSYEEKQEKKGIGKGVIILLSVILAVLVGALIATIIYRTEVTEFLVNLFGLEA